MGYYQWAPYVTVAERRRRAEAEAKKSAAKGRAFKPVRIVGRKIVSTFWGKAWCDNLESYSDFANRLPRGRSYVRNGSVIHLEIEKGVVTAKVAGSSIYEVRIGIDPLKPKAWNEVKRRCSGGVRSLLDLLSGKLSEGVMSVVTDRSEGLFPKPKEIHLSCSCPDWATMCKHVAATLYGVGARLDEQPELLFHLRGVNHEELVSANVEKAIAVAVEKGGKRRLAESEIADVFGIEMEGGASSGSTPSVRASRSAPTRPEAARPFPEVLRGADVRALRERLGLNGRDFASLLGVSGAAVSVWERKKVIEPQLRSREALEKAWKKAFGTKAKKSGRSASARSGAKKKQ